MEETIEIRLILATNRLGSSGTCSSIMIFEEKELELFQHCKDYELSFRIF